MNIKSIAAFAVVIASFTIIACQWFASAKKEQPPSALIGRWHLDSLKPGKDSSLVYAFIGMAMNDSAGVDVEFRKDTILSFSGNTVDTTAYELDTDNKQIHFKDSLQETMLFTLVNDSLLSLTTKDSAVMLLKKR